MHTVILTLLKQVFVTPGQTLPRPRIFVTQATVAQATVARASSPAASTHELSLPPRRGRRDARCSGPSEVSTAPGTSTRATSVAGILKGVLNDSHPARLREWRGTLPADFKFDRDEANAR